jgi:hypothetical protein
LKSVGSQSVITLFLEFAGTLARVFTTFAEVSGDKLLLRSAMAAASLNGILLLQYFMYSGSAGSQKKKLRAKKE